MAWQQISILIPSFLGHWLVLSLVALAGWFAWTRIYTSFSFKWQAPLLIAFVFSFYQFATTTLNLYQSSVLYSYQQNLQSKTQSSTDKVDPVIQAKNNFLMDVEKLVQNPDKINKEIKENLFKVHASVFANEQERNLASQTIVQLYECQRFFWEDALASFQSKSAVKSNSRKECEGYSGAFLNREKLIPVEAAKNNDEAIAKFAARKRMPAADGKEIEVSEKMLRESLDGQIRLFEASKLLLK